MKLPAKIQGELQHFEPGLQIWIFQQYPRDTSNLKSGIHPENLVSYICKTSFRSQNIGILNLWFPVSKFKIWYRRDIEIPRIWSPDELP
jgi:hypothetical protein